MCMWKDGPCEGCVDGAGGVAWCMGKKGRRCVVVCACEKIGPGGLKQGEPEGLFPSGSLSKVAATYSPTGAVPSA